MLYCSWDMVCEGCNCYFSFWAIFCIFILLTARKMKISRQWKKHLEISSFYTSVPKIMIIWYTVPEIWCVTDVSVFHFGYFFPFYPLNSLKNQKLKKNKKIAWRYQHFTHVYKKWWLDDVFLRHGARQTDGKSDI